MAMNEKYAKLKCDALVQELQALKPGMAYALSFSDLDDIAVPWSDPFGSPTREEKVEWLRDQLKFGTDLLANFDSRQYHFYRN